MIAVIITAIVLWLAIGLLLTVYVFSQFPFIDGGWHFVVLWPVVLMTCLGPIPPLVLVAIYGVAVWGLTLLP